MRHASDSAHAWARNIKVRDARAKHVLRTVCLYVNEDGMAWPSVERLAEDTEQSPNTIRSRLRYLADIGVIARLPRWIDEHGKRNAEARGRRTTDELRLLFDVSQEQIDATIEARPRRAAHGEGSDQSTGDDDEIIEESTPGNADPAAHEGLLTPSGCEPPGLHLAGGLELSSEQESPNPKPLSPEQSPASEASPPSQGEGKASTPQSRPDPLDSADSPEMQKLWSKFCSHYPEGVLDVDKAQAAFRKLPLSEATDAVQGVELYADRCKRVRQQKPMKAHLFLAKRTWAGLLASKPTTKRVANFTLVPFNSKRGRAVANLYLMTYQGEPVRCRGEGGIECYSVPIAPTDQVMALADVPRRSQWEFYPRSDVHKYAAWSEFIQAHTGKQLWTTAKGCTPGFFAPHPWPPRTDGTWSESPESPPSTGPPSVPKIPELTEDDIDVLTGTLG